jgi:hypothetical protein
MQFYTYLWLREDGTPYYVGKGTGKRAFNDRKNHRFPPPPKDRILLQEFPDEESAFIAEAFLIALYGREDLGEGTLLNLTDGGEGCSGRPGFWKGKTLSEEHRKSLSIAQNLRYKTMSGPNLGRKFSEEVRKRNSESKKSCKPNSGSFKKGQRVSPSTEFKKGGCPPQKDRIGLLYKGTCWMNNGETNARVKKENIEEFYLNGFVKGCLIKEKAHAATNFA